MVHAFSIAAVAPVPESRIRERWITSAGPTSPEVMTWCQDSDKESFANADTAFSRASKEAEGSRSFRRDGTADWRQDADMVVLSDRRESTASSREEIGPTCDAIFQTLENNFVTCNW